MSERTARKYEGAGQFPSQLRKPRMHRTRDNPFELDWPWVEEQLARDPALQTKTLFALLCEAFPGRYQEGQLRTLQRHVQAWRVRHGPEQECVPAGAPAGTDGAVRFHDDECARDRHRRHAVPAPGLPPGAHLLERGGGAGVLLGDF